MLYPLIFNDLQNTHSPERDSPLNLRFAHPSHALYTPEIKDFRGPRFRRGPLPELRTSFFSSSPLGIETLVSLLSLAASVHVATGGHGHRRLYTPPQGRTTRRRMTFSPNGPISHPPDVRYLSEGQIFSPKARSPGSPMPGIMYDWLVSSSSTAAVQSVTSSPNFLLSSSTA